jgi:hypothetical protein
VVGVNPRFSRRRADKPVAVAALMDQRENNRDRLRTNLALCGVNAALLKEAEQLFLMQ